MPPPQSAVLPEMVELETSRVPELLNAPPLPPRLLYAYPLPEIFAPETVTSEMKRFPPLLILNILKPPLLPSMLSEEAPRPAIVTLPAVPALTTALASTISGNADSKAML